MRISLNLIIGIWTGDKKHNGMKKYLLHTVHMKVKHVVFFNHFLFCAKTEINPTIIGRRCLSIVICSVRERSMAGDSMGSYRDAY